MFTTADRSVYSATFDWVVPNGVTQICVVAVGRGAPPVHSEPGYGTWGGGGGGGALSYRNALTVTPGETLVVNFGGASASRLMRGATQLVRANYGNGVAGGVASVLGSGASYAGGAGGSHYEGHNGAGGGAGGYAGVGGAGRAVTAGAGFAGAANGGGGGGGGISTSAYYVGGGGGVGVLGIGATGIAGANITNTTVNGGGGSDGENGAYVRTLAPAIAGYGGDFGGGAPGGGPWAGEAGLGSLPGRPALRIIWGAGRSFPNNAGDV